MKEFEGTPGPWAVDGFNTLAVIAPAGKNWKKIVDCNCSKEVTDIEMEQANAKLIASAPELLEACKWMHTELSDLNDKHGQDVRIEEQLNIVNEIIIKATI